MVTFFSNVCCKIIIIQTHISIYNIFFQYMKVIAIFKWKN